MKKKTKIIATLGPSTKNSNLILEMIKEGVNVFRINFSHADYEDVKTSIQNIRQASQKLDVHVAILADLQGPKLRIGIVKEGVVLKEGQEFSFITNQELVGDEKYCSVTYEPLAKDVKIGEKILVDDGKLILEVIKTNNKNEVVTKVIQGGVLKSKKGVNLPYTETSVPAFTDKDEQDVIFAIKQEVDWIALSFVRQAKDIILLKKFISLHTSHNFPIIAKIEKPEAVKNINEILKKCDGLMVARGDLGVEIPPYEVPLVQKKLIDKAKKSGTPVIIATQMIETMIDSLTPTRAEVSDIANAVIDGADAVMVSGETSVGKYPLEVIKTMADIIKSVESSEFIKVDMGHPKSKNDLFITKTICYHAASMAEKTEAKGITTLTDTGYTAFKMSSWRPESEIFVFTSNKKILNQLSLLWGVTPFYYDKFSTTDETIEDINNIIKNKRFVEKGDMVINLTSTPIGDKGKTNTLKLSVIE